MQAIPAWAGDALGQDRSAFAAQTRDAVEKHQTDSGPKSDAPRCGKTIEAQAVAMCKNICRATDAVISSLVPKVSGPRKKKLDVARDSSLEVIRQPWGAPVAFHLPLGTSRSALGMAISPALRAATPVVIKNPTEDTVLIRDSIMARLDHAGPVADACDITCPPAAAPRAAQHCRATRRSNTPCPFTGSPDGRTARR